MLIFFSLQSDEKFSWILDEYKPKVMEHLESWSLLIQGLSKVEFIQLSACPDTNGNKVWFLIFNCSSLSNYILQCKLPMYHLLHLHLELRWQYLCLLHAAAAQQTETNQLLESAFILFLTELVKLAESVKEEDYSRSHPFICTCVRQFWLMLQIFSDKMFSNGTISQVYLNFSLFKKTLRLIFSLSGV